MACNRLRRESMPAPKFFKIVFDPQAPRLRIPTKFTQRYGRNLPKTISLEVPNGSIWKVELSRCDGEIWVEKGWLEFKEYYSLGFGHLLVFEYDETTSYFHVLIFDMTATEIEYPSNYSIDRARNKNRAVPRVTKINIGSKADDSVLFLKNIAANQEKDDVSVEILNTQERRKRPKAAKESSEGIRIQSQEIVGTKVVKTKCMTYQIAKAFMSDNPTRNPFYISVMQPSCISHYYSVSLPLSFGKANLGSKRNNLTLCVPNGKK